MTNSAYMSYPVSSVFLYFVQNGVMFSSFAIFEFVLQSVQLYLAVFLIYFISDTVIPLASDALMAQFSLQYNKAGKSLCVA